MGEWMGEWRKEGDDLCMDECTFNRFQLYNGAHFKYLSKSWHVGIDTPRMAFNIVNSDFGEIIIMLIFISCVWIRTESLWIDSPSDSRLSRSDVYGVKWDKITHIHV